MTDGTWREQVVATEVGSKVGPNGRPVPCDVGFGSWTPQIEVCMYCEHSAECAAVRLGLNPLVTEGAKKKRARKEQTAFEGEHGEVFQCILVALVHQTHPVMFSPSSRCFIDAEVAETTVKEMFDYLLAQPELAGALRGLGEGWLVDPKKFRASMKVLGWK